MPRCSRGSRPLGDPRRCTRCSPRARSCSGSPSRRSTRTPRQRMHVDVGTSATSPRSFPSSTSCSRCRPGAGWTALHTGARRRRRADRWRRADPPRRADIVRLADWRAARHRRRSTVGAQQHHQGRGALLPAPGARDRDLDRHAALFVGILVSVLIAGSAVHRRRLSSRAGRRGHPVGDRRAALMLVLLRTPAAFPRRPVGGGEPALARRRPLHVGARRPRLHRHGHVQRGRDLAATGPRPLR